MKSFYSASATILSGTERRIVADEPKLNLELTVPKAMGGPGGEGTNPEQLFAAGYASCFSSAISHVAEGHGVELGEFQMVGRASIGKSESGGYGFGLELTGTFPGVSRAQAEQLMTEAEKVCPYANATRGNIEVKMMVA